MRILYGVPSEGMGHAIRSKAIISHLKKEHEVLVVSSDRAHDLLEGAFPGSVHRIKGFHFGYKDGGISRWRTLATIMKTGLSDLEENYHSFVDIDRRFKPHIVVSDFETFSLFFAKRKKLPIVAIDNVQIIDRCSLPIEIPLEHQENMAVSRGVIKAKVPYCDHYVITSFFDAPTIKEATTIVQPIIREEVVEMARKGVTFDQENAPILVYQTSQDREEIMDILGSIPGERFMVYGFNEDAEVGNVTLKGFSEEGFLHDLCNSKAVVTGGGFTLMSEALFLRRPILSIPLAGQIEQYINAACIESLGYGRHQEAYSADGIRAFL